MNPALVKQLVHQQLRKNISMSGSAPPPYTPADGQAAPTTNTTNNNTNTNTNTPAMGNRNMSLAGLQQNFLRQAGYPIPVTQRPVTTDILDSEAAAADDPPYGDEAPFCPLAMRINTSLNVSKNDNIVCLADSPAQHASAIAAAVTKAIEDSSSGGCGIPMIDGDGNPRPMRVEIDAGTVVDGQNNVVATESVIHGILKKREELIKLETGVRRRRGSEDEDDEDVSMGEPAGKRRRSG